MKATLLLAALIPFMAEATEKNDTTFTVNEKQIVVRDSAGLTRIKVYAKDSTELTQTYETAFADGQEIQRVYVSSPFIPRSVGRKRSSWSDHYPAFYMGFSTLPGSVMGTGGNSEMHTRDSNSWEWGMSVLSTAIGINNTLAVTSAVQLGQMHHHFQDNYVLTTNNGVTTMRQIEGENLKKSYISYSYLRIPVMLDWQKRFGSTDLFAAFGVSLEYRDSDHSRYFIGKHKNTETNDINLNPLGLNLELSCGYGVVVIYARAAVTPLLKTSSAPKCYPFSVGLGLNI